MARNSGTRTLPPTSGTFNAGQAIPSGNPVNYPSITQYTTGSFPPVSVVAVRSDVSNFRGRVVLSNAGGLQVVLKNLPDNVGNLLNNPTGSQDPLGGIDQSNFSTTDQRKAAQAYFSGGVGIEKDLAVGGFIYGRIAAANTATTSSNLVVLKTNADEEFFPLMTDISGTIQQGALVYVDQKDSDDNVIVNQTGLLYNPLKGRLSFERGRISSGDPSINTMTGAFTVTGGVGIGQDINVGGNIFPGAVNTGSIGRQDFEWESAYLNKVYTKILGSTSSNLTIAPGGGMTDVFGDIRVSGNNPIGTAPVVTNTLYVTMDGNDTNDGRAQDTSRACRTIGGAMKSPYYQPGTQILVSAGRYLEDNPLRMKPYTSVRGSDIRTTFIEPINKTQDLFHCDSGCYLNYMTFLNGRSGRLEGQYDERFNRGAYATAFPPLTGDNRIDLFQSPYIQNCTNQSGPWLRDGTMFRPNQTVQVPEAVGIGSWPANTASIIVSAQSGDIRLGHSINAGQQNPGFFNARTLLLANKPFIQSQTVAWVDATFNSGSFSYNKIKCQRDTGLIIAAIAQDMLYDSTSDSTFAGIQYWNQEGYTGQIPTEITATIQAITYLKSLVAAEAFNTGGLVPEGIVNTNFDTILGILNTGTTGVTDQVIVNDLPSVDVDINAAYTAIIDAIPAIQDSVIDYIETNNLVPDFTYDQTKCSRDTGLIVDALALDLAFIGNSQSTFAGLQYWNQGGYTGSIGGELTTTTAAINYVKSLAQKIVVNDTSGTRYQTAVAQVLDLDNPGTGVEASAIADDFTVITDILTGGTAGVTDIIVPNSVSASTSTDVVNAYNLLQANKAYLKAEAIAYVEATKTQGFEYDQDKCFRDTGLIVDAVVQDILFSTSSQSTFAGLQYWSQTSSPTQIAGEETTTTNAINWIKQISQKVVVNDTSGQRYHVGSQITGDSGSTTEGATLGAKFDIITDILINGVEGITDQIVPNGITTSTNARVWNAYKLLQANKTYLQDEAVAYVEATKTPGFSYNTATCYRDVGYIIDSVSFDLLYGGNRQSIQSGVYYYGYNGSSSEIPGEIPQTTAAWNHIRSIIPDIIAGTTVTNYQNTVPQVQNLPAADSGQAALAQGKIDIITGIISGGPGAAGAKTPISLTKTTDVETQKAADLIYANRAFIQAETIAYIDATYPPGFQYDQEKCARDVDYMVDSVSFDLLHGGNKQAVQSGVYYYSFDSSSTAIPGEIPQTTAAYNKIKDLLYYVIQGISVPSTFQGSVTQDLGPAPGTIVEVLLAQKNIDYIVSIINNGPGVAAEPRPISLDEASDENVRNAAAILEANRNFIRAEVIAYINSELASGYDQTKCRRDVEYITKSVAYDMLHGGNLQSIKSGVYYYSYGDVNTLDATNEIPATTAAYNFIKSIIPNIVTSDPILSPFQNNEKQILNPQSGADFEVEILQNNLDIITNILRNGPSVAGELTPIGITQNTATGVLNAYSLLIENIPFIKAEVIAFLDQTMNNFEYNRQKCYRDAGIIVENMAYDMAFGGNQKSVESGLSYYVGVTSVIAGQESQTIGAIDYIGELAKKIVQNETCPVLTPPVNIPVNDQVINTALTGGAITLDSIENLLNATTTIIANGPSAAPEIYAGQGPDAAFVSAEVLMQANRTFIQESVLDYINYVLCDPPKPLPYNSIKCKRDTKVIIDSVAGDLLFPTDTNSQAVFAGLQYFNRGGYTGAIKEQLGPTIAAMTYLRDLTVKVAKSITAADDEALGTFRYSDAPQITRTNIATENEIATIKSEFGNILTILNGRTEGWTDLIVPNGGAISMLPSVRNTANLLLDNIDYLAEEVASYVDYNKFKFDESKCFRDSGLIVDAITLDMLYPTTDNSQSTFAGLQYWNQDGYTGNILDEVLRTTDAINYVRSLAQKIVTNDTSGVRYQVIVSQNTLLPAATAAEAALVGTDFSIITNILTNGTDGVTDIIEPNSVEASTATNIVRAYDLLQANRSYLQAEAVAYVNSLSTFVYDQAKCSRDTGLIVDAVAFDLLYPTISDSQSTFAGLQYWNQSGYTGNINTEVTTTTNAINYLKTEIASLTPTVSTITNSLFDTIVNIINTGTTGVTDIIVPNGVASTGTVTVAAYNAILGAKSTLISNTINYINSSNPGFVYDQTKCRRDLGYIIDSVIFDLLHSGNRQSVQSGVYYYNFNGTTAIPNEIPQTSAAYRHLKKIAGQIVKGEAVQKSTGNAQTQVTNLPWASQSESDAIGAKVDKILNIITNGPSVVDDEDKTPISLAQTSSQNVKWAFALLNANRAFIQAEIIAYINQNYGASFTYDQAKCSRDVGYMVDSVSFDLLHGGNKQAVQSGVYYYDFSVTATAIPNEIPQTIDAFNFISTLVQRIILNQTSTNYQYTYQQDISLPAATASEQALLDQKIDIITDIIQNGPSVAAVPAPISLTISGDANRLKAAKIIEANRTYIQAETVAYVNRANAIDYDREKCKRDVGYITQSIVFDLLYGGNRQSIQSGLCYYAAASNSTVIPGEVAATVDAFGFMATVAAKLITGETYYPLQTKVKPILGIELGSSQDATTVATIISTLTNIIQNGPSVAGELKPISLVESGSATARNAFNILKYNKDFLAAEVVTYINRTYNPNSFEYDQDLCYRDTGLIIDAVSQDILLGGNQKSIEAGVSYWNQGFNYVAGQVSTTTAAINYARDIALKVIANTPVATVTSTVATQVINPFYQYGEDYMPQEAVARNFGIITKIIEQGPTAAPPIYAGGGLFSITGIHPDDVKIAPKVTALDEISPGVFRVGLDTPTVGFGINSTLYFGETFIFPLQDPQVREKSLEFTGNEKTWDQRRVDPIGSMGGTLIDGAVISDRSPIQSFVFDAFTQLNQGGIGMKITNNGYAQLVSVFTIFCSIGVICNNGGIASITNSNCNFGDISLLAKGYGKRSFSGTVFNPIFRAYPFSPQGIDANGNALPYLDQFYPEGFWPNAGKVAIFVPDVEERPHIGQVMEIVPPKGHVNEQNFPGFLNATPSAAILNTGTIDLTGISTTDVYIGNTVYIRDQFGRQYDDNGVWYVATGTTVADVNFDSITLSTALTSGGGDPTNPNYFTLYFCGNSYYTVLTSTVATNPYKVDKNILSSNSDPNFMGPSTSQISAHISAINHLNAVVDKVIANVSATPTAGNTSTQVKIGSVVGGSSAQAFIDLRFSQMTAIIGAPNITAAKAVVPANAIVKTGTVAEGAGSAVTLIQANIDFLADEVNAYVTQRFAASLGDYNNTKCIRDVKLILQQIIYDLQTGGNYNSVNSGLSYWGRQGTYHIVELGEAVNRPDLFPDGSIVNFYQRSYISASGYLFEYVGAGTNYGALPQRGVADPVQVKETVQLNSGKVYFTSTDQNGDFRIGPGLVISQATGVLSGRTFVQSLYANMTPFILAIS